VTQDVSEQKRQDGDEHREEAGGGEALVVSFEGRKAAARALKGLHAQVSNLHFEQFYCLVIARCGGARQQLAERFVICRAVSFDDLINLGKDPLASSLVHYCFPF
jgi:hypothetical protein